MAPRMGHVFKTFEDRFFEKVSPEPNTGCWLWTGADNGCGYGTMTMGHDRRAYAHRLAYELFVGPVPDGLHLDHLCRVRCCVNPSHLEPVTNRENARRGNVGSHQSSKTHCIRGHAFDEHGYRNNKGNRQCRLCTRMRQKSSDERKRNVQ